MSSKGLNVLRKYEEDYWQALTRGREFLPEGVLPDFLTVVRQVVIHDCIDGYLILRYGEWEGNEFIIVHSSFIKWKVLLHQQKLYDQYGRESTQRFTLQIKEPTKFEGHSVSIGGLTIPHSGVILHPKWLSATIVVGEPSEDFSNGDEAAKRDIRTFLSAANLGVPVVPDTSDRVIKKLESLLAEYRQCLAEAKVEEDAQKFLKQNPFVLSPWGTIHPKYRLGREYVCDFLIEDRLAPDFKYIFVELEPAKTELFHKGEKEEREFKARVHHGLSQLGDWEIWIRENRHTFKEDFPEFDQAGFILVIGRSTNLSSAQRKVIMNRNARAKNLTILTYDDLANRLEELINSLRDLTTNGTYHGTLGQHTRAR